MLASDKITAYRARLTRQGRMLELRAVDQCLRYIALEAKEQEESVKTVEKLLQKRNKVHN